MNTDEPFAQWLEGRAVESRSRFIGEDAYFYPVIGVISRRLSRFIHVRWHDGSSEIFSLHPHEHRPCIGVLRLLRACRWCENEAQK